MHQIVEIRYLSEHRLLLRFTDGAAGEINLAGRLSLDGVFASLRDAAHFGQVRLDAELGTIIWPSGADLCPDVLHGWLAGEAAHATTD
ncbi:MAG: DUF2442 domain-containing protein [Acetobacteraceae bacterium]